MKRILTGTVFGALLIGTILLRTVSLAFFDCFIGIMIVLASYEMCNALAKIGKNPNKYVSMIYPVVMYVIYLLAIRFEMSLAQLLVSELGGMLVMFGVSVITDLIMLNVQNKKKKETRKKQTEEQKISIPRVAIVNSLNALIVYVYPCLIMGLMFFLNHIKEFAFIKELSSLPAFDVGFLSLALLFTITFLTDIFAMVVGSVFKGPKLCPFISPKKTISGAIGGVVFAIIGAIILYFSFSAFNVYHSAFIDNNITVLAFIIIAFIGSVFSQIGDIFASVIKRKAGIKDYGNILPGHGGVLDRFDGVIFNIVSILCFTCIYFL